MADIKLSLIVNRTTFALPAGKIGEVTFWRGSLQSADLYCDSTARDVLGWINYIAAGGSTIAFAWEPEAINNEYVRFYYYGDDEPRSLKITNQTLAEALGFPFDVAVSDDSTGFHNIYGTTWGNKRLVVSGSANSKNNHITVIQEFPFKKLDFPIEVTYFNKKPPISPYDKSQDKKRYGAISNWVGEEHFEDVRNFMHECRFGAEVTVYNVSRPDSSMNWYFDLGFYNSYNQDGDKMANREIGSFGFGVVEI